MNQPSSAGVTGAARSARKGGRSCPRPAARAVAERAGPATLQASLTCAGRRVGTGGRRSAMAAETPARAATMSAPNTGRSKRDPAKTRSEVLQTGTERGLFRGEVCAASGTASTRADEHFSPSRLPLNRFEVGAIGRGANPAGAAPALADLVSQGNHQGDGCFRRGGAVYLVTKRCFKPAEIADPPHACRFCCTVPHLAASRPEIAEIFPGAHSSNLANGCVCERRPGAGRRWSAWILRVRQEARTENS